MKTTSLCTWWAIPYPDVAIKFCLFFQRNFCLAPRVMCSIPTDEFFFFGEIQEFYVKYESIVIQMTIEYVFALAFCPKITKPFLRWKTFFGPSGFHYKIGTSLNLEVFGSIFNNFFLFLKNPFPKYTSLIILIIFISFHFALFVYQNCHFVKINFPF